ncbi:hypothetical protein EXE44_20090, partial [Halorubrum sp. SS7]|uniref:twin-arginine translocation signal domain-containing protein n=1 Tax=Halorubrum sp. SS7 TaxID=2518119 RepID=UPI0010F80319
FRTFVYPRNPEYRLVSGRYGRCSNSPGRVHCAPPGAGFIYERPRSFDDNMDRRHFLRSLAATGAAAGA